MKLKIIVALCFLTTFLLSFRFFWYIDGAVGHNWDWALPGADIFLSKLNVLSLFTWRSNDLGAISDLTIVHLVPTSLFSIIGPFLGVKKFLFWVFFSVTAIAFISFKKLLDFLTEESFLNYIPSLLYAFSPFLFNDIIGGAWVMWVSYAFSPIYFVVVVNYFKNNEFKYLLFSLLTSIWVIISIQYFVLINLLVMLYLIYEAAVIKDIFIKNIIKNTLVFSFFLILVNFYWIFPFGYSFLNFAQTTILESGNSQAFDVIRNSAQSIWNILNLVGYFDRNMYLYSMPLTLRNLFQLIVALAWLAVLGYFLLEKNRKKAQKSTSWMLSLLLLTVIVKGGNKPFSEFTLWLYENFPLIKLYRSPQHLMFVPAFIIPILIAFSLNYYYGNTKYKKIVVTVFSLIVMIWINGWWFNGDLGHKILMEQNRDYVDFYQLSPGLKRYYEGMKADKADYRVFFLPAVRSPMYIKTEYQNKANGIQPEYTYLDKQTFTSESSEFANKIETLFGSNIKFDYINYLRLFSVRDIVLRYDIYPHFTESAKYWDSNKVKKILGSSTGLNKFLEGKYEIGYRIKPEYFLSHIYPTTTLTFAMGGVNDLPSLVTLDDFQAKNAIFLSGLQEKQDKLKLDKTSVFKDAFILIVPVVGEQKKKTSQEPTEENKVKIGDKYRLRVPRTAKYEVLVKKDSFLGRSKDLRIKLGDQEVAAKSPFTLQANNGWIKVGEVVLEKGKYPLKVWNEGLKVSFIKAGDLVLKADNPSKKSVPPKIQFNKVNPTKYVIRVSNAKDPYHLVFSESFHSGWKAYIRPAISHQPSAISQIWETWFRKPLPESRHFLVNGYANSWYIEPKDVDGHTNYEVILEFWPQRLFYLGLGVSLITLMGCIIYLMIPLRTRKTQITRRANTDNTENTDEK